MLRIFEERDGQLVDSPVPASPSDLTAGHLRWIDVFAPTPEEDRYAERAMGIVLPTREEMRETELSARLYVEDGAEFLTATVICKGEMGAATKSHVTFVLKGDALLTLRYDDLVPLDMVTDRLTRADQSAAGMTAELLMLHLLEAGVNRLADIIEQVSDDLDQISEHVFRERSDKPSAQERRLQGLIERIGRSGRTLGMVRECLVSVTRLMAYHLARMEKGAKRPGEIVALSKIIQRDASALTINAEFLSAKIGFLLDAVLGLINLRQAQIIKLFSVAAVVFLPPTLIASIYGMNFDHMPELAWLWGYPMAVVMMIVSAVVPYLFFKHRGWL